METPENTETRLQTAMRIQTLMKDPAVRKKGALGLVCTFADLS